MHVGCSQCSNRAVYGAWLEACCALQCAGCACSQCPTCGMWCSCCYGAVLHCTCVYLHLRPRSFQAVQALVLYVGQQCCCVQCIRGCDLFPCWLSACHEALCNCSWARYPLICSAQLHQRQGGVQQALVCTVLCTKNQLQPCAVCCLTWALFQLAGTGLAIAGATIIVLLDILH